MQHQSSDGGPPPERHAGEPPPGDATPSPPDDARQLPPPRLPADATPKRTPGGYEYTVVDDSQSAPAATASRGRGVAWPLAVAVALVAALLAAAGAWFASDAFGGDDSDRVNLSVGNVLHAFSDAQGGTLLRYEGRLPDGFPDNLPTYRGARVRASVLQVQGQDAGYLVIYDTDDSRAAVTAFYRHAFDSDPWQIELGHDDENSALYQYNNVEDPDIEGIVLVTASEERQLTTIIISLQVVAGAIDHTPKPYAVPPARDDPAGLPPALPVYESATLVESSFQRGAGGRLYSLTYITEDDIDDVLDFYVDALEDAGFEVDRDPLDDALLFSQDGLRIEGEVLVATLAEDAKYRQIVVQLTVGSDGGT